MTDSWVISSGGTSVTLPVSPQYIEDQNDVNKTHAQVEGQKSVVVSEGLDVRVLTLKGFFYTAGQNKSYLDTNFCVPLQSLNRQIVNLSSPTTRYNGAWLLIVKSLVEQAEGYLQRYTYQLLLEQGGGYVIL